MRGEPGTSLGAPSELMCAHGPAEILIAITQAAHHALAREEKNADTRRITHEPASYKQHDVSWPTPSFAYLFFPSRYLRSLRAQKLGISVLPALWLFLLLKALL